MALDQSSEPEPDRQSSKQIQEHWQCPQANVCQILFSFAGHVSAHLYDSGSRFGEGCGKAKDGIEECFVDLHGFLIESFDDAERIFNARWGSRSINDNGQSTQSVNIGEEDEDESSRVKINEPGYLNSLFSCVFPGYFENSWIMRLSQVDCAVYAFEVLAQPDSLSWQAWLYKLGAAYGPAIAYSDEWWRFLTPVFLHGHMQHLACNVIIQCRLGYRMERMLGGFRFCIVYMGSALVANLLSIAIDPFKVSVGASTSIFGLLGSNMVLHLLAWNSMTTKSKIFFVSIGLLTGATLIWSPLNVDFIGHSVGLISGACLTILLLPERERRQYGLPPSGEPRSWYETIALMLLGLGIAEGSMLMNEMPLPPLD